MRHSQGTKMKRGKIKQKEERGTCGIGSKGKGIIPVGISAG